MTITSEKLALLIDNNVRGLVLTHDLKKEMARSKLVIVYGESDDLVELEGAINDEIGAYNGTTFKLSRAGLLPNDLQTYINDLDCMPEDSFIKEVTDVMQRHKYGMDIKAVYGSDGKWTFQTDILHHKATIFNEDGTPFSEVLVIDLNDLPEPSEKTYQEMVDRVRLAETVASSVIEAIKTTEYSTLLVKTSDLMPEHAGHALQQFLRIAPERTTVLLTNEENFSLQMLNEDDMKEAGWVRQR